MTIKVAGNWELSWNTPIKESELWSLPLRDFQVTEWFMWPVSGIRLQEQSVNLHERANLFDILEENAHLTFVFLEPPNAAYGIDPTPLTEFEHPEDDVLYVFGSAHYNPVVAGVVRGQDHIVYLPTAQNRGVLWPHQVLVTTLFHRMVQ